MIRPFTCVCMLLAGGSGLYLYQTKHQSQMLDREIAHTMRQTEVARARAGVLQAEYALLNDPSRLSGLAGEHLASLKTTAPTQFTTWADFEKRLPPVGAPAVEAPPLEPEAPGAKLPEPAAAPAASAPPDAKPEAKPEATRPLVASVARPVQPPGREPAAAPRPAPAQAAQPAPRPTPTPVSLTDQLPAAPARPATPHPVAVSAPAAHPAPPRATVPDAPPSGGITEAVARIARGGPIDPAVPAVASALGMARSMTPSTVTPASAATVWQPSAREP
jgi:hypothetical protein